MIVLNYFYFIIITYYGIKFLLAKRIELKNPLNNKQTLVLNGSEMFFVFTFSTGLLAFSAPGLLDLMAIRLLVLEVLCIVGMIYIVNRKIEWNFVSAFYLLYIIWLIIGLYYSPSPSYGFRVILKYAYPLIIMLFASTVVRDSEIFFKASIGARKVALLSIIIFFTPFIGNLFPGVFWYGTAAAINYICMFVFSLALFYFSDEKKKNLLLSIIFTLPCFLWVFRTSIMGTLLALMIFMFFKYRLKSLPWIIGVLLLFIIAVFYIPSIQEKMFFDKNKANISQLENQNISIDNINSNGRFAMWEWSLKEFYKRKELTGTGTGNLQETFYSLKHPFGSIRIVHNDYVQILCDNGLIGLCLFGGTFLFLIIHCFIVYQNRTYDMRIRICAIVAGSSAGAILLTMYTDNVINYSMATISYPCGFYGMLQGMLIQQKQQ